MNYSLYFFGLALAVGFGLPLAAIGAAAGQGRAAASALDGMARQPELAGTIRTGMILALAFIESLVIYALLMFFLLQGKLPSVEQVRDLSNTPAAASTTTTTTP